MSYHMQVLIMFSSWSNHDIIRIHWSPHEEVKTTVKKIQLPERVFFQSSWEMSGLVHDVFRSSNIYSYERLNVYALSYS